MVFRLYHLLSTPCDGKRHVENSRANFNRRDLISYRQQPTNGTVYYSVNIFQHGENQTPASDENKQEAKGTVKGGYSRESGPKRRPQSGRSCVRQCVRSGALKQLQFLCMFRTISFSTHYKSKDVDYSMRQPVIMLELYQLICSVVRSTVIHRTSS